MKLRVVCVPKSPEITHRGGYKRATNSLSCKRALSPHFSSARCTQLIPFTARSRLWGPTPFPFLLQYFLLQLQSVFSWVAEEHLIYFLGSDRKQRHSVPCSPLCSQGHPSVRLGAGILSCRGGGSGVSSGRACTPHPVLSPGDPHRFAGLLLRENMKHG